MVAAPAFNRLPASGRIGVNTYIAVVTEQETLVDKLAALSEIVIVQQKELGETLTGFEGKNRYAVHDPAGNKLYAAVETGNSWIGRQFLKAKRPFTIELSDSIDTDGTNTLLRVQRPFAWYFHEASVTEYEWPSAWLAAARVLTTDAHLFRDDAVW